MGLLVILLLIVLLIGWLDAPGPHSVEVNWSPHWSWGYSGTENPAIPVGWVLLLPVLIFWLGRRLVRGRDPYRSPEWGRVVGVSTVVSLCWVVVAIVVDASPRGTASLFVLLPAAADVTLMGLIVRWWGFQAVLRWISTVLFVISLVVGALIGWVALKDPISLALLMVPAMGFLALGVGARRQRMQALRPPIPSVPVPPAASAVPIAGPNHRAERVGGCLVMGVFLCFVALWALAMWPMAGSLTLLALAGMAAWLALGGVVGWWTRRRPGAGPWVASFVWLFLVAASLVFGIGPKGRSALTILGVFTAGLFIVMVVLALGRHWLAGTAGRVSAPRTRSIRWLDDSR